MLFVYYLRRSSKLFIYQNSAAEVLGHLANLGSLKFSDILIKKDEGKRTEVHYIV